MSDYQNIKAIVSEYFNEMEKASAATIGDVLRKYTTSDYTFYGVHPFNEISGGDAVAETVWKPLYKAFTPIQRRQDIFIAGTSTIDGDQWVTSMGHFMGLLDSSWLGIPATRKMVFLRYAEFNSIRDGKICKTGFFCDIIGLMHQAGVYPLPPQTGAQFIIPGPRTHDGLQYGIQSADESTKTLNLVAQMRLDMRDTSYKSRTEELKNSWDENMIWYGPTGIGSTFTIDRYQKQHQGPYRDNLITRKCDHNGHICHYAEGKYASWFGWPSRTNTPTGGFLGMPANDTWAKLRVVDIYRREGNKLVENWVFIDILYWLYQQGLDVLERSRQLLNN
ncbi:MAG: nuclear transport factor 2 family protein [Spirochaetia bacterium]|nr:nuclear transport factor 2 family protein [Spirochaetia bacterium]